MTRRWGTIPDAKDIPGNASAGYEYTRKNPSEGTWLDSGGIPSNKTGIPFGLANGVLDGVWVGSSTLSEYDISVYWHDGDETNLTLLTTVSIPNTDRTKVFDSVALGSIPIPQDVQLATRIVNIVSAPADLKVYLRPTGDAP